MKVKILGSILTASALFFASPALRTDFAFARDPNKQNIFRLSTSEDIRNTQNELRNGKGPVVILVSGFGGCRNGIFDSGLENCIARSLFQKFRENGIAVYDAEWSSVDATQNFGSDKKFREQMRTIILPSIPDNRPIILIGHSFGGDSVLKAAQDANVIGKRIALLAVLDGVAGGNIRTREAVPANVDYFYNRWTTEGTQVVRLLMNVPVDAKASGKIDLCSARDCRNQHQQSVRRDENGNVRTNLGGLNKESLYHGVGIFGNAAIHDDAYIQASLFELTNSIKLAVDPPSRSDVAGLFRSVNNWVSQTSSPQFVGGFPNFQQAAGNMRGIVSINAKGAVWRDILGRELGDISSDAKKIAAVDEWARANGYAGGLPNFNHARNNNGENVHGAILFKSGLVERRVIDRAADLKNKYEDLEALFRSVDNYAGSQGFAAGYPSMRWTGRGDKIEVVLIKNTGIEKQDVAFSNLVNPPQTPYITITPENNGYFQWMFRNVNTWVDVNHKNYFVGGFPNFQARDYLRGTLSIGRNAGGFKDIPIQELGDISSPHKLIAAVDLWARQRGFAGGLPTFYQARYNGVEVRGAILINPNSAERRLVSQNELNNFEDLEGLFRAADEYANKNGFRAGYPSLRKVGNQGTIEVVLMRKDAVAWNDVSLNDLKSHTSNVVYRIPQLGDPGYIATSTGGTDGVIGIRREISPVLSPDINGKSPIQLTLGLQRKVTHYGQESWQRIPENTQIYIGETIRYVVTASNFSNHPVENLVVFQEIPKNSLYFLNSATLPRFVEGAKLYFSIDGGKTYSEQPMIQVKLENGEIFTQPAPADRYTNIKWDFGSRLPAGTSSSVTYQVLMRDVQKTEAPHN
ncbi:hypothetical protein [Pseudanabaena minima]|uniref:hypothetical protein n=1 Tax=Pseudanabaena minima TaxID=890415 RepID=UPI003DA91C5F